MGKIHLLGIVCTASTHLSGAAATNPRANSDPLCAGETQTNITAANSSFTPH